MNISERLVETTTDVRDQAAAYVARAAEAARASADRAADKVAAARNPLEVLTDATQKLNTLSHDYVARLLARQAAMLKGTLTEGEKRLQRLARAASLQQAVAGQAEDLNQVPQQLLRNARETWEIMADAGRGVSRLASETYADLVRVAPTRARKAGATRGKAKAGRKGTAASRRTKARKAA